MEISDIKRWQWILIGIIAGLGLGWVWSGMDPGDTSGRQVSQVDFENDLLRQYQNQPLIKDIVIQPTTTDYSNKQVQPVSFRHLKIGQNSKKVYYVPAQYVASVPYKPLRGGGGATPAANFTLKDYLNNINKQRNGAVHFAYGWWQEKPATIAIWTLGTAVVIGGIWPTFVNLLVGAGPRERKVKAKKEDYFDRFSHEPDPAKAGARVVGDAERQRLDDMNRALEQRLQTAGVFDKERDLETEQEEAEVRKLQGGPLETAPVMQQAGADDEIEVKGEFYPVLIHHKKGHDDDAHHDEKVS